MAQMRLESWEGLKGLQRSHGHEACVYEMIRSVFFLPYKEEFGRSRAWQESGATLARAREGVSILPSHSGFLKLDVWDLPGLLTS